MRTIMFVQPIRDSGNTYPPEAEFEINDDSLIIRTGERTLEFAKEEMVKVLKALEE